MWKDDSKNKPKTTSWEKSGKWYQKIVGEEGHYYHKNVVIPNIIRLLHINPGESVLDLACGQGILSRHLPNNIKYTGIDIAPNLIAEAEKLNKNTNFRFLVADVGKPLPIEKTDYDKTCVILALQNIKKPFVVIKNAYQHLRKGGELIIVLNHPAFRIPKYSSWEVDKARYIQYRRVDSYMTPLEIPILTNPGKKERSETTVSFHYPISAYSEMLFDNGFAILKIEEWVSDKTSTGGAAKMENKARKEFPMFMCIVAKKI